MRSLRFSIDSLRRLSWPWMTAIYVSAILGMAYLVNPPMYRHLQAVDKIEFMTFGNMPLMADLKGEVATLKTQLKYHSRGIYSYTTYYNGTEEVTLLMVSAVWLLSCRVLYAFLLKKRLISCIVIVLSIHSLTTNF